MAVVARLYRKVAVAGTFDFIHCGHADLFDRAFEAGERVAVGVTSSAFARRLRHAGVKPFSERLAGVKRFLGRERLERAEFFRLDDAFGPSLGDASGIEALVVSTETLPGAEEINALRRKAGRKPLAVIAIPLVYAEDLKKVASRRVRRGKISAKGRLLSPVVVAVGTLNPSKVEGVKAVCGRLFPSFRVRAVKADSRVPEQPFAKETLHGAVNRAIAAQKAAGADYGVGLESGLFKAYGRHFDFQWCAVYDGENATLGCSMGFEVPGEIVRIVSEGGVDMGKAFERLTGIGGIGRRNGAIGFLSRGLAERREMSEQAFLCAMIPRLNKLNYGKQCPESRLPGGKARRERGGRKRKKGL
jgi:inosine/xanthosine triphosphatase